jgi:hypothetical protein
MFRPPIVSALWYLRIPHERQPVPVDGRAFAPGRREIVGWKSAAHSTIGHLHGVCDGFVAAWWITPLRG